MKRHRSTPVEHPIHLCEAEAVRGLEFVLRDEIERRFGSKSRFIDGVSPDGIRFEYQGNLWRLRDLGTAQAAYLVQQFPIPRPKAVLGHQYWQLFAAQLNTILKLHEVGTFRTFTIAAAGSESSVMQRIKQEITQQFQLIPAEKGDLWIRIRPSQSGGWETLMRLTPRPLSTRDWRVANYEGSLNAVVAHAMSLLTQPKPENIYVNLGCGSGSLLIERLAAMEARQVIGIDHDEHVLGLASLNIQASHKTDQIDLIRGEISRLPLQSSSCDSLTADLPFGQRVGTHKENLHLYPLVLSEAARVARPGAHFVIITHEIRLIESVLSDFKMWHIEAMHKITLRGLHPRIYVLRKR
jgi:23S rRNA G2445 N2-methylase RlmL